ncbi:MAG TPA: hypothetical protein VMW16_08870 [Sedimentisphaerales bacterium]|nr:hypothetical protein [Sedimentisphaerales bacterium]
MIEMDANHCQVVEQSLTGGRALDEQTFASLAILSDRLERVKSLGGSFAHVGFSPAAKGLLRTQRNAVAVG